MDCGFRLQTVYRFDNLAKFRLKTHVEPRCIYRQQLIRIILPLNREKFTVISIRILSAEDAIQKYQHRMNHCHEFNWWFARRFTIFTLWIKKVREQKTHCNEMLVCRLLVLIREKWLRMALGHCDKNPESPMRHVDRRPSSVNNDGTNAIALFFYLTLEQK